MTEWIDSARVIIPPFFAEGVYYQFPRYLKQEQLPRDPGPGFVGCSHSTVHLLLLQGTKPIQGLFIGSAFGFRLNDSP